MCDPRDEAGATMVEYGFLLVCIAIAAALAVTLFGQQVLALFTPLEGVI